MKTITPYHQIRILTEELIITKADIDFSTNPDKRERAEILERQVMELMR